MLLLFLACEPPTTQMPPTTPTPAVQPVCGTSYELLDAPEPIETSLGPVATVDLHEVTGDAVLSTEGVQMDATARFTTDEADGLYAIELAQQPDVLLLDGMPIDARHVTVGDPARQVLVLDTPLAPCTTHELTASYSLPVGWMPGAQARLHPITGGGMFWSAGLEDADPGNFLGMWLPSNLLFDRFDLTLSIALEGLGAHQLASTGQRDGWTVHWTDIQAHTPFWVVSPVHATRSTTATASTPEGPVSIEVYALERDVGADLDEAAERAVSAIETFSLQFGPYAHGDRYVLWIRDDQFSSMEYDGATVTAMGAIEHEIMHSWYARGASPLRDVDGWVDEAVTSWVTDFLPLRHHPVAFEGPAFLLRHGDDGWDGPRLDASQYIAGSAIFADIAWRYSVVEVTDALGAFYLDHQNASYTDVELEEHLTCWFDVQVRDAFLHQAYGVEGPSEGIPSDWCD